MASTQTHTDIGSKPDGRVRVLLFTNSITVGGMEEHVELLARHLDRSRFEVFAMCPDWTAIEPFARSLGDAADHLVLHTPDRRYGTRKLLTETLEMARQLRRWRIQVVHMHSTTYRGQYYALLAARLAGVPRIFVTEHLAPDQTVPRAERFLREVFTRSVTGIVCVSQKNYQARAAHLYTPAERTTVVNNGVDLDDFPEIPESTLVEVRSRHGIPHDAEVVGTAVRFEPEKGLEYMIDAMPRIKAERPNAHFLMVGDGSLRDELAAHVARVKMTDCVHFTGFQNDPRSYVRSMDVFVLPVPVGSMSIGLLEAMAMKRAVVMTFGGEGEAVIDGESGLCAEPRNPDAIADCVIRILRDRQFKEALGEGARKRIETEFSAQQVARSLGKLYAGALPAGN